MSTAANFLRKGYEKAKAFVGFSDPYKILLIGETGSGKTSFLNFLCNSKFVQQVRLEDALDKFRRFNNIKLENPNSGPMESKTSGATLYPSVQLSSSLTVTLIDTPGFGDSRGMDEDKKHSQKIVNALKEAEFVNCICLVINGSMSRMNATLKYVLTEVTAILPREVLNNVIVVFTNIADPLDLNFKPSSLSKYLGKEIESNRIFLINNPYCRVEKAKERQGTIDSEMIARSLKKSFDEAREMLTSMCSAIEQFKKVHTHHFVTLYETKLKIDGEVTDLLMEYQNQKEVEKEILKAEAEAEAALAAKKLNAGFRTTQVVKRWVREDTSYHNTLCRAKDCFKNCHKHCSLDMSLDAQTFESCAIMCGTRPYCNECGHHYTQHYHGYALHHLQVEETELIDKKAKKKFEAAKSMEERAQIMKAEYSRKKMESELQRKKLSQQLLVTIEKYQRLGVTRNYARVLAAHVELVEHYLQGEDHDKMKGLTKTKEELKKKLELVEETLKEPWSHDADPEAKRNWACAVLDVPISATKEEVEEAFRKKARTSHPDKQGGDEEHFKRVEHAKSVLIAHKY